MNTGIAVVCFAACLAQTLAHMCLVNPHQRGSMMGLNQAGSTDCILLNGPCGGRTAELPSTMYRKGGNYSVIFQKNLDHWIAATPGYFSVSLIAGTAMRELSQVQDNGEPSLTLYSAQGKLPSDVEPGKYVIQVTYISKNPAVPAVFYQCADVVIM